MSLARGSVENVSNEIVTEVFIRIILLGWSGQPIEDEQIEHAAGSVNYSPSVLWTTDDYDDYYFEIGKVEPGQTIPFTASLYTLYDIASDWTYQVEFR